MRGRRKGPVRILAYPEWGETGIRSVFGKWNRVEELKETERELVAAGVVLGRHQHQAGPDRRRLRTLRLAEGAQDAENCDVGCQDAEADRGDHGDTEDERH